MVDLGCGDGKQARLIQVATYVGFDPSIEAIKLARERCAEYLNKSFSLWTPTTIIGAELALSMDVIFHILDDEDYERYMEVLFKSGADFVAIHSTDYNTEPNDHVRHRAFQRDVERWFPGWELLEFSEPLEPDMQRMFFYGRRD